MTTDTNADAVVATTTEAKPRERKAKEFKAVLKRGKTFTVRFEDEWHRFAQNEAVSVSAKLKDYLEENAIDLVTTPGEDEDQPEIEKRQKFEFKAA